MAAIIVFLGFLAFAALCVMYVGYTITGNEVFTFICMFITVCFIVGSMIKGSGKGS